MLMRVLEGVGEQDGPSRGCFRIETLRGESMRQLDSRHEFHHDERVTVKLGDVVNGADVGMAQFRDCPGFAQKAVACGRRPGGILPEHLDSDLAPVATEISVRAGAVVVTATERYAPFAMMSVLISLLLTLRGIVRSRAVLHLEVLALRYQLQVLQRSRPRRLRLAHVDRRLWTWLSRSWPAWRTALVIVKPETVLAWHRQGFRLVLDVEESPARGRPTIDTHVRALIRDMGHANPLWGAPRIHGELLKLGLEVSQATVAKYMPRRPTVPSQSWRTFLANHARQIAAADFFVVPTATWRLCLCWCSSPTSAAASCTSPSPTIRRPPGRPNNSEKPSRGTTPRRYLVHDRDTAFVAWATTASVIDIEEVITAAHSPWQNAYAERLIGSIRRECLDHVIVANARGLRRVLPAYVDYYLKSRTHLALGKDAPVPRPVAPPGTGAIVAIPHLGGLHHCYERQGA